VGQSPCALPIKVGWCCSGPRALERPTEGRSSRIYKQLTGREAGRLRQTGMRLACGAAGCFEKNRPRAKAHLRKEPRRGLLKLLGRGPSADISYTPVRHGAAPKIRLGRNIPLSEENFRDTRLYRAAGSGPIVWRPLLPLRPTRWSSQWANPPRGWFSGSDDVPTAYDLTRFGPMAWRNHPDSSRIAANINAPPHIVDSRTTSTIRHLGQAAGARG